MMKTTDRIAWVDTVRGLCIMAILFFHTEKYYAGEEIIPYALYVDNAIITFFFVSGYLFHRPGEAFSARHKLLSVGRKMVIPYFLFTLAIALPKAWAHADTTLTETLTAILTGHASWFVAALIVTEVCFAVLLKACSRRQWLLRLLCVLPYPLIAVAYDTVGGDTLAPLNLWCWQNAMLMMAFFFAGYACRQSHLLRRLHRRSVVLAEAALLIALKVLIYENNLFLTIQPVHVSSWLYLLADGLLGAVCLTALCRVIPRLPFIEWTGRHSLIYYFICGGVPFTVTLLFAKAGFPYDGFYPPVILAFIIVYLSATLITWILNPFMKKITK